MFTTQALILFLFLGALAGVLAGLFGIGGGIILIPCFLWAFPLAHFTPDIIVHTAFGTSLAIIIPTSLSSAWGHRKRGNVDFHAAWRLAGGSIIGVMIGASLAAGLSGDLLKGLMGIMQISIGLRMFFQSPPPEGRQRCDALLPSLLIGLVVGAFSAFFGVGGGIIAVPLLVYFLGQSMHQAAGTSSALMVVSALCGTASYIYHGWGLPGLPPYSFGYVNLLVTLLIAPLTVLFARVGVKITSHISHNRLFKAFALFIIIIGISMVGKNLLP